MCSNVWPLLLDLSRDECKRILRRLELEAYSSVISAFRAQGDLTKDKKKILQDLQNIFSISTERHRAEVRRALNDEKLASIADNMSGPDISSEWLVEGRRLVPLMPRLVPQTAFTLTANSAANMQAEKNLLMPSPLYTGNKEVNTSGGNSTSTTPSGKSNRPTSPASNVVVLPSGMSIHIKGGLSTEDEDIHGKKRRRSSSTDSVMVTRTTPVISTVTPSKVTHTMSTSNIQGISPMKITFTKSPAKSHTTVTPSQKVILVSSAGSTATPTIVQKSITVPTIRSGSGNITTVSHSKPNIIMSGSGGLTSNGNLGNIVTVAATSTTASSGTAVSTVATATTAFMTSSLSTGKPRPKTLTRPKAPQTSQSRAIMLPVGSSQQSSASQNIQIKQSKPTIQIKQEGGMKIITQGYHTSKILPKPAPGTGSPVVVVTTAPSTITMVTKTPSGQVTTGKVVNISTQGGKVITTSRPQTANVVTVNPKTLQLTAIKGASGTTVLSGNRLAGTSGTKPNVIVVQKAQPKRFQTPTIQVPKTPPATLTIQQPPYDKEVVSFIQKQDPKTVTKAERKMVPRTLTTDIVKKQQTIRKLESTDAGKSSLLAELIQAVGIVPEVSNEQELTLIQDDPNTVVVTTSMSQGVESVTPVQQKESVGANRWVELDVPTDNSQLLSDPTDVSAIKALLDLQSGAHSQDKPKDLELSQRSQPVDFTPIPNREVFTIEQAASLLVGDSQKPMETITTDQSSPKEQVIDVPLGGAPTQEEEIVQPKEVTKDIIKDVTKDVTVIKVPASTGLGQLTSISQDILGELDPQTGLFYSTPGSQKSDSQAITTSAVSVPVTTVISALEKTKNKKREHEPKITITAAPEQPKDDDKKTDFLSSALTEAEINLDPYQFIDEDEPPFQQKLTQAGVRLLTPPGSVAGSGSGMDVKSHENKGANQELKGSISTSGGDGDLVVKSSDTSQPKTLFIPLTEVSKTRTTTINVIKQTEPQTHPQTEPQIDQQTDPVGLSFSSQSVPEESLPTQTGTTVAGPITMSTSANVAGPVTVSAFTEATGPITLPATTNVAVTEESEGFHVSHVRMEELASQRFEEKQDLGYGDVGSPTGGSGSDGMGDIRLSKRKRKPPPAPDDNPPQTVVGGWIRLALGLLHRVSRFRGVNKEKGDMNAASWFTRPVDPSEAPDYYTIITQPMDFSKIKRRLETGYYRDWEDFHTDMVLVRDNCHQYNPIGHEVRKDCDEVFTFYQQEYEKVVDKWQKSHISTSPVGKKIKLDKSPVR